MAEIQKFNSENPWYKKIVKTISGKKPKMTEHKELKAFLESMPEKLDKMSWSEMCKRLPQVENLEENLRKNVITEVEYSNIETKTRETPPEIEDI